MASDQDRLTGSLIAFIRSVFPGIDHLALYPAKVIAQGADGSLDLVPDDPRIAHHQAVPIRLGLPGASVKVTPGSRVLLGFENGDSSRPYASVWDIATCTELDLNGTVVKLNSGATPVAKVGSPTVGHVHALTGTAGPFPLVGTAILMFDTIASGSPTVLVP